MASPADFLLRALNHLVHHAPWAADRLRPFAGEHLRIDGAPFPLTLAIAGDGHFAPADDEAEPAVTITLPPDFLLLALVDRERILANARLSGSAELAETLAFVFRNLRWDVEADLAGIVGDIAAHRLVQGGRQLHDWQAKARANLASNIGEYLGEEQALIATADDIDQFSRQIAVLRDDVDRLEKRLKKLEQR